VKEIERIATTRPSVTLAIAEWQDQTDKALVTISEDHDTEQNACFLTSIDGTTSAQEGWWADSCSTVHITNDLSDKSNPQLYVWVITTGAGPVFSTHIGTTTVQGINLMGVLVVPNFPRKIISTGDITSQGGRLSLGQKVGELTFQGRTIRLIAVGKLHKVEEEEAMTTDMEWHERYGHLPFQAFSKVPEAPVSFRASRYECDKCAKAKMVKPVSPAQNNQIRTKALGELVHSDVCGPFSTQDARGNRYIVTLIDDFSRFVMARAIQNKSDVERNLQELIVLFETMSNSKVANLHCDFGGEYRSKTLMTLLRKRGIDTRPTVAYHSQTNAVAERTNRTIVTNIRANLGELPKSL